MHEGTFLRRMWPQFDYSSVGNVSIHLHKTADSQVQLLKLCSRRVQPRSWLHNLLQ